MSDLTIEMGDSVEMVFCRIPAGSFRMGSSRSGDSDEKPAHRVRLVKDYWLGKTPVTQEQFGRWTGTEAYRDWFRENEERLRETSYNKEAKPHENRFPDRPRNPADQVTWWEGQGFGEWVRESFTEQIVTRLAEFGVSEAHGARLPTEAEWEHACRAGSETEYHGGEGEEALERVGWYEENAGDATREVGQLEPNQWSLHDLHGNVDEWCLDAFDENAYRKRVSGVENPWTGGPESAYRVVRGGSWFDSAGRCRAAYRDRGWPGTRFGSLGFRLGLFPGPVAFPYSEAVREHSGEQEPTGGGSGAGGAAERKPEEGWSDGARLPAWREKGPA